MHPFVYARVAPDKPACIMAGSGEIVTYRQLEDRADRTAHLLRSLGLKRGDCCALMMENNARVLEIAWAAQRCGLYLTAVSSRLTPAEAAYIIKDSGSKALFTSKALEAIADKLVPHIEDVALFMVDGVVAPFQSWEEAIQAQPAGPVADESPGDFMLYSSGTTGRPKGVKRVLPEGSILVPPMIMPLFTQVYGADQKTVYLTPAPLYHAAPLGWSMMVHRIGGTLIVMEHFDAEDALRLIEKYGITHGQFVPTHFTRMLKLPEEVRDRFDSSSLKTVFHAAAPCPVAIKERMIDWWGPIIHEYYAGTEGNGITTIAPNEWLNKKGSVGRPAGCQVHICDENGDPLPQGAEGQIFFAGGSTFEYHNDPEKTGSSRNKHGWSTLGDVGRLDEDGYLFLTDRKSFMIISGGVNVYPQEIENVIATHPRVADVAVIGAPDEDLGERVVAIVQPHDSADAGPELAEELRLFCRKELSGVKTPRQFDFIDELPREPTGKLFKKLLREKYWAKT